MLNQKDKLQRFVQVVEKNANDKCNEINANIQFVLESQLEQIRKQYSDELSKKLEASERKTRTEINRKIATISAESKKIIAEHRNSISDRVFDEVNRRLQQFCESEEYSAYLEGCLEKVSVICSGDAQIFTRAEDNERVRRLSEKFSFVKSISTDESISIGGIVAVTLDGRVKYDCTLGHELEQSREWFRADCFGNV